MEIHLVDGTYELFRYHYAPNNDDPERGASAGVVGSVLQLIEGGATHVGIATDFVIESFRNDLWPDYKTGDGMDPQLLGQFRLVEDALEAAGFAVWPQEVHEADDGLAAGAALGRADSRVERVVVCTPDKDMAQLVDDRVIQWDRRQDKWYDAAGVHEKFGVPPASIPDWLALVGDSADGFPGLPGWGAKSAAAVLDRYGHIEDIPLDATTWDIKVRGGGRLATTLADQLSDALLFKRLATLEPDAPVSASVDEMAWAGPTDRLSSVAADLGAPDLVRRAERAAEKVAGRAG